MPKKKKYNVFSISKKDVQELKDMDYDFTYGELTKRGVMQLNAHIPKNIMQSATFYDLGCGDGCLLLHLADINKDIPRLVGVELVSERVENALLKISKKSTLKDRIEIIEGDICDVICRGVNIVYVSNLCFPDHVNKKISSKLSDCLENNSIVFSSKPLYINLPYVLKTCKIHQSWSDKSDLLIYTISI
jgi:tRNA G46 methylase TrmB